MRLPEGTQEGWQNDQNEKQPVWHRTAVSHFHHRSPLSVTLMRLLYDNRLPRVHWMLVMFEPSPFVVCKYLVKQPRSWPIRRFKAKAMKRQAVVNPFTIQRPNCAVSQAVCQMVWCVRLALCLWSLEVRLPQFPLNKSKLRHRWISSGIQEPGM